MLSSDRKQLFTGLCFISPWVIGFVGLTCYPLLVSLYYSFCDYDVLSRPVWIGMTNYQDMISDDLFWKSLYNTLFFASLSVPLGLILSLLTAVWLNSISIGRSLFRTLLFMPSMMPLIAVAMIWLWLFNGKYGLINYGLGLFGIAGPDWLGDENWTKITLVLAALWQTGGTVVICLAALQDVPRHLYEAADIDGAGRLRKLWHVTLPMISPVIYFNFITAIIGSLQVFVGPFVMLPNGGPDRSALFYSVYLFQNAFSYNQMGYACAMAWVMFVLVLLATYLASRLVRKHVFYAGG